MELKDKTILILSQQDWGDMFISKHHYSNELAKRGNKVYYINGPDQRNSLKAGEIKIETTGIENLFLIRHRLFFPYIIRFKAARLYYFLVRLHINKIVKKIGTPIDIVWSFDLSNTIPLKYFPDNALKVFMPVDESGHLNAINAAEGAQIILSVTQEIIDKYHHCPVPRHFINHGVADTFINTAINTNVGKPIHIALSGNFLRPDMDYTTLFAIIDAHKEVIFDFWGSYSLENANVTSPSDGIMKKYTDRLSLFPNVILHGSVPPGQLSEELKKADGFLICYDIEMDQSKGTNYHKVLEYLATGKVIISSNITTYDGKEGLIEMAERGNNNSLLPLFSEVIAKLDSYNGLQRQMARIEFARKHIYSNQINKIELLINKAVA